MKTALFNLFLFLPIIIYAQNKYEEEANYIQKNCNEESFEKANKIYSELQKQQTDNSFDRTLSGYYEFLESTKCKKYDPILIFAWENDKVISAKIFKSLFRNSNENYNAFVNGFSKSKSFRFANMNNLDQGIDDKLQIDMLKYLESKSKEEFNKVAKINIQILEGQELIHFVSNLKSTFDLKLFEQDLIDKSMLVKYPFDLDFLVRNLMELDTKKLEVENILNQQKEVWDKGNWSKKFWSLIRANNLKIEQSKLYSIGEGGKKRYDVKKFIETHIENNSIGNHPLLFVNHSILNYEAKYLVETLDKLDIKDIQVKSKENATSLYGARGKDGVLVVLTN